MKSLVRRFTESLMRLVSHVPVTAPAAVQPYSCVYVAGPTARRTGERPPRGEDSPLVRPYLAAHERQMAEARRRRCTLWLAVKGVNGVHLAPRPTHGAEDAA